MTRFSSISMVFPIIDIFFVILFSIIESVLLFESSSNELRPLPKTIFFDFLVEESY